MLLGVALTGSGDFWLTGFGPWGYSINIDVVILAAERRSLFPQNWVKMRAKFVVVMVVLLLLMVLLVLVMAMIMVKRRRGIMITIMVIMLLLLMRMMATPMVMNNNRSNNKKECHVKQAQKVEQTDSPV